MPWHIQKHKVIKPYLHKTRVASRNADATANQKHQ